MCCEFSLGIAEINGGSRRNGRSRMRRRRQRKKHRNEEKHFHWRSPWNCEQGQTVTGDIIEIKEISINSVLMFSSMVKTSLNDFPKNHRS